MKATQRAKEYLSQIHKTDKLISRLMSTVATLRSSLTSQSYELKPDKVQTSGPKDLMAETIAKIDELERQINDRIDELVDLKQKVFSEISRVSDFDQQNVLIARYVQNKKWDVIAAEFDHEARWVFKVHGLALAAFAEKNPESVNSKEQ